MVVRNTYRAGDWLVKCDRCHMTRYRSECRFTWDNLLVCGPCWAPRHPQDFVRGLPDDTTVPVARPDIASTMGETTLNGAVARNAMSVVLPSGHALVDRDSIGITLNDGTVHWTFVDGTPPFDTITLGSYMPGAAATGNTVYLPRVNNFTWVTATTPSGL